MKRDSEYYLDRLRREHPDIAQRVDDDEITVYAAIRKAGYSRPRTQRVQVSNDATATADRIIEIFGKSYASKLAKELDTCNKLIQRSVDQRTRRPK